MFLDAVTENDMRSAVKAVVDQAKNGDLDAAKLLFDRVFGKVSEPVDPDHVEVDGMQLESRARALESMNRPMPTTAAEILRG